jgi:hypothetical protein
MPPFEEPAAVEFDDDLTSATFREEARRLVKETIESKERELWKINGERDALERTLAKFIDKGQGGHSSSGWTKAVLSTPLLLWLLIISATTLVLSCCYICMAMSGIGTHDPTSGYYHYAITTVPYHPGTTMLYMHGMDHGFHHANTTVPYHPLQGMVLQEQQDKIKVLEQYTTKQEEEMQHLKRDLESSKTKIRELSCDKDAHVDLQENQNKIEVLEQQGANQQKAIQHLKEQLEFKTKKVEEWKDKVEEKEDKIKVLKQHATKQEEEIQHAQVNLREKQNKIEVLEKQGVNQHKEVQRLKEQQERKTKKIEKWNVRVAENQAQIDLVEQQLTAAKSHGFEIQYMLEQQNITTEKVKKWKRRLQANQDKITLLELRLTAAVKEIQRL